MNIDSLAWWMSPPLIITLAMVACGDETSSPEDSFELAVPATFPAMTIPEDNPPSAAKIKLGRFLFYDKLLSGNETYSCATCHRQELAFTDGRGQAKGSTDQIHSLGSMSLANVGYAATLGWGNPTLQSLEAQALVPMFGEEPIELGLSSLTEDELLDRLKVEARYQKLFPEAFPQDGDPFSVSNVVKAISTFERTMLSADSPYDRFQSGDADAMSPAQVRGMALFFSERLECFHCHGGFNFSDSVSSPEFPFAERPFHNNGMYNVGNDGSYPQSQGAFDLTDQEDDRGRFKAPTLRNIAVTAPYLHDGSVETLSELIDFYAAGGRVIESGELAGDGTTHPNKSSFVAGFDLSEQDKEDLLAFLNALTDESFLSNPDLSDPFEVGVEP